MRMSINRRRLGIVPDHPLDFAQALCKLTGKEERAKGKDKARIGPGKGINKENSVMEKRMVFFKLGFSF